MKLMESKISRFIAMFILLSFGAMAFAGLTFAASISGQVFSKNSGKPIGGCQILIWKSSNSQLIKDTFSNVEGMFTISDIPQAEDLLVEIIQPFGSIYLTQYYNGQKFWNNADWVSTLYGDVDLDPIYLESANGNGVHGRIHDADNKGISAIRVNLFSKKTGYYKGAVTDGQGFFGVTGLSPSDDYVVSVHYESDGLSGDFYYKSETESVLFHHLAEPLVMQESTVYEGINIVTNFDQGGNLEGYVRTSDGKPVSGIWVNAWSEVLEYGYGASSDADGYFKIRMLLPVSVEEAPTKGYIVEVNSDKYPYQAFDHAASPASAVRVETGKTDILFELQNEMNISGTVTDDSGLPIENATVAAWSSTLGRSDFTALSNVMGMYSITGLPALKNYRVSATAPNYPTQYYNLVNTPEDAVLLDTTRGSIPAVDFKLDKRGVIKGYVTIQDYPSFEGIKVEAISKISLTSSITNGGTAITQADGFFEIIGLDTNTADYIMSATKDSFPKAFYNVPGTVFCMEHASEISPSRDEHRNILLQKGFNVRGSILYNQNPISGITIQAVPVTACRGGSAVSGTGTPNNYMISGLMPGEYVLKVKSTNFDAEPVQITLTDHDIDQNFDLISLTERSIAGTVTNLPKDEKILIRAASASSEVIKSGYLEGTGEPIVYVITGLSPVCDYQVELISEKYPAQRYTVCLTVENQENVDFILPDLPDTTDISGVINFPDDAMLGEPIVIESFSLTQGTRKKGVLTYQGNPMSYTIENLIQASDYVVSIRSDTYQTIYYNNSNRIEDADMLDLTDDIPDDAVIFTLKKGAVIYGKVLDAFGSGISGIRVKATSKQSGLAGSSVTALDGSYSIKTLISASDYIVEARHPIYGSFFYGGTETVRDRSLARRVDLTSLDKEANLYLYQGAAISGIVTDEFGIGIAGIRIDAGSEIYKVENSTFSGKDGSYEIKGLPEGTAGYKVSAVPEPAMPYMQQTRTDITAGGTVNFVLYPKMIDHGLTGTIRDEAEIPIPNTLVEVWSSDFKDFNGFPYLWAKTDYAGKFEIKGLTPDIEYIVRVYPPMNSLYAFAGFSQITVNGMISFPVTLQASAKTIQGTVSDIKRNIPVQNAKIIVSSIQLNYRKEATTNKGGIYRLTNLADGNDYTIRVVHDGYIEQVKLNQFPATSIDFELEPIGTITGNVRDSETGTPVANALIEVHSASLGNSDNFGSTTTTDENGDFIVSGLRMKDNEGLDIWDYMITVYSDGYPPASVTGRTVGDHADIFMIRGTSNTLFGTVENAPSGHEIVLDIFVKDGPFVKSVTLVLANEKDFKVSGLRSDLRYQLKFTTFLNDQPDFDQWVGSNGNGIPNTDDNPPLGTGDFSTLDLVSFRFTTGKRNAIYSGETDPGAVRNLESISHVPVTSAPSLALRELPPQNVETSPFFEVSNNPNVTVIWEAPLDTPDASYYSLFTTYKEYQIDKRNAPQNNPVKVKKATSFELNGEAIYYFHVAAVDDRGRIGKTSSISFNIDTLPPKHVSVRSKNVESSVYGSVTLELVGVGASEVFISDSGYGENGEWENFTTVRNWYLRNTCDTIYVQFRDLAGNVANSQTTVCFGSDPMDLENVIKLLKLIIGVPVSMFDIEDVAETNRFGMNEAIYYIQKAAGLNF